MERISFSLKHDIYTLLSQKTIAFQRTTNESFIHNIRNSLSIKFQLFDIRSTVIGPKPPIKREELCEYVQKLEPQNEEDYTSHPRLYNIHETICHSSYNTCFHRQPRYHPNLLFHCTSYSQFHLAISNRWFRPVLILCQRTHSIKVSTAILCPVIVTVSIRTLYSS